MPIAEESRVGNYHNLKPRFIGAELRPFAEHATLILTPRGETFRVEAEAEVVRRVLEACDGTESLADIAAKSPDPDGFTEMLTVLLEENCLSIEPYQPHERDWIRFETRELQPSVVAATHVVLLGDDHLISQFQGFGLLSRFAATTLASVHNLNDLLERHAGEERIVIALRSYFDATYLAWLDAECERLGVRWTQFHLDAGKGWLGPSVVPGKTANYRDLLVRRRCAADYDDVHHALTAPPVGTPYLPPTNELLWMLSVFVTDIERWLVGAPCRTLSSELEANPLSLSLTPYPVLPLPNRPLADGFLSSTPLSPEVLLNDRSGVILKRREIKHHPSVPAQLRTVQTHVASMARHYPWSNDMICGGSAFGDLESAAAASVGEAVERYCGNYLDSSSFLKASYNDIVKAGERALDPETLILFTETIYNTPGCPFVRFSRDLKVHWVQGWSLTGDAPAWLPVSLVYVNWCKGEFAKEQLTNYLYFPGIAAGTSLATALVSALEEVVERDITMIWWMNRQPLPAMVPTPELAALWQGRPHELGQRAWLIHLDNEFNIPVMAGVLENVQEGWFNIGFAARPGPEEAAEKAWTEALTLQEGSRDLNEPPGKSLIRQAIEWEVLPVNTFKPWREDRRYLDDYRSDFRDVDDLMSQQQVYLDLRAREAVRPWTDVPASRSFLELPRLPDRSLTTYRQRIEGRGYEIFYADITTSDVAHSGLKVVRALVPGLVPNFPAAFPPVGGGRVQHLPVQLGWRTHPLAEHELNYLPLPHA